MSIDRIDVARNLFGRAAAVVARSSGLRKRDVINPSRRPARRARRVAVYLTVVGGGVPCLHVARALGLARSNLQRAIAEIEDARDEPAFDEFLVGLEGEIAQ